MNRTVPSVQLLRTLTCISLAIALPTGTSLWAQNEALRIKSGQVKVGDRILANVTFNGDMHTCAVLEIRSAAAYRPGYDGDYVIHCDHNGWNSTPATGYMKVIAQGTAANPRGQAAPAQAALRAAIQPPVTAIQSTAAALPAAPRAAAGGNDFGTRNPRSCGIVTGGVPSPTIAAQLVACAREAQSREREEYLVDAVRVTSMTPSRYDPHTQTGFTNMDTSVSPVAIRGSLQSWSCRPQNSPAGLPQYSNVGKNCSSESEVNATGYCYKLRTGAWSCVMSDVTTANRNRQDNIPPPR